MLNRNQYEKNLHKIISIYLLLFSMNLNASYDKSTHSTSRKTYEDIRQKIIENENSKDYLAKFILTGIAYTASLMGSILADYDSVIPKGVFQIANIASTVGLLYCAYNWAVTKTEAEGKCDRYTDNLGKYVPSKDEMDSGIYIESYENNGDFNGYKYNISNETSILK